MSLKIVSSEKFFNAYIETFQSDNAISPGESIKIASPPIRNSSLYCKACEPM
ncbi:hypothetical protein IV505_17625 [Pseudomonas fulva]|nr:hypothetical protein [Pseudomonas fulva]MBF8781532.1 hypothetical protein [Pseudomonas fulva]